MRALPGYRAWACVVALLLSALASAVAAAPSSQPIARRTSPVERSIRNVVMDVANEETATPAKIRFVVGTVRPIWANEYTR